MNCMHIEQQRWCTQQAVKVVKVTPAGQHDSYKLYRCATHFHQAYADMRKLYAGSRVTITTEDLT